MKTISVFPSGLFLTVIAFLVVTPLCATNRYISSSTGNDGTGNGTISRPWASLNAVTSSSVANGDSILFKRGDVFILTAKYNLPSRTNLHFAAYGTGAKPLFHSLETITGWVNLGGNVWEAPTKKVSTAVNLVLRNGTIQQVGRYPNPNAANAGYLINTATSATSITGPAQSSTTNWTGAEVAMRSNHWTIYKRKVTGHSGGTITFSTVSPTPKTNFGYFFQRDARTVDQDGEWFMNGSTKKLRMYFANNNPSAYKIQAATVDTLIYTNRAGTTFTNLQFTGCNMAPIVGQGVSGIIIEDCDVTKSGMEGFKLWFCTNSIIQRCTADSCLNNGILNRGSAGIESKRPVVNLTVQDCFVNHTSPIVGMENNDENSGVGLRCSGGTGVKIFRNVVRNSGYIGIEWYGDNVSVKHNLVDTFCTVRDDGGGIYTWETAAGNQPWIRYNRTIDSNIVLNGIGQSFGTPSKSESSNVGIYVDDNTRNVRIMGNTIAYIRGNGIHGNGNDTNTIIYNTIFYCGNSISMQRLAKESEIRGMIIKSNIMYPYRFRYRNLTINLEKLLTKEQDVLAMGVLDSNYYATRAGADTGWWAVTQHYNTTSSTNYKETWQPLTALQGAGQEKGSKLVDNTGSIEYNASGEPKEVSIDGVQRDVYGNIHVGSISIGPWSSVVLIPNPSKAGNYYVSNLGNDANSGTAPSRPWKTITRVNAANFTAGDSILFRSGDTFIGTLVIKNSGTISNPIVIGSYGPGDKPVITGMVPITGWTNLGSNIYQGIPDSTLKANVNILTIGGIPQAVGRTPWMAYQTASSTQLTSSSISGTFTGAEIVMRKTSATAERATVTAQAGTTVTYQRTAPGLEDYGPATLIPGIPGYGFFFQRFAASLDQPGEWYFNAGTNRMRVYSPTNPSSLNVKASYADTVISLGDQKNIVLSNLAIEGGGMYGVAAKGPSSNLQVRNCSFTNNTKALYMWNVSDAVVTNSNFNHSFNGAIFISNPQARRITVQGNTVSNTGQFIGNGVFNRGVQLKGIVALVDTLATSTYVNVINNKVTNTGSAAIQFQGFNSAIRANVIDSFGNVTGNTGGILTTTTNSAPNTVLYTGRVVDSNFVSNGLGAVNGSPVSNDVNGFYFADQSLNINARRNTIYNMTSAGIQLNNANNIRIEDNVVYNTTYAYQLVNNPIGAIANNHLKKNQFYQQTDLQYIGYYSNANLTQPPPGQTITNALRNVASIDSNYISNQKPASYHYDYSANGGAYTFPPDLTLDQWKTTYGHEINSVPPAVTVTPTNTTLLVNPGYSDKKIDFPGLTKVTAKGNVYHNSITLPAFSSAIMIDTVQVTAPNKIPTAEAGPDTTITLPVSSVTLMGSASDSDGVITSYAWVQLSGPIVSTIVSPASASTVVNGLTVAGIYQYQLTVTDNGGATATAIVKVTVNESSNVPPTVNAGADVTVQLPVNSTTLTATPGDVDGNIIDITWSKYSGGSGGNITNPKAASTTITNLQQGAYEYKVVVTDNRGGTAEDIVKVTVLAPIVPNQPPTANAGPDQTITLPTNSTTLAGTASDADGTFTVIWKKQSGGTGGTLSSTTILTPTVSNLQQGIYVYELAVTDDDGAMTTDVVTITVNTSQVPNQIPVVYTAEDVEIALPTNTATIEGYAVDVEDDESTLTYEWTKFSGPDGGTITNPSNNITTVTGLLEGTYIFQLSATDSDGGTGTNVIQVVVTPAVVTNRPPVVTVTADKTTLTLPENFTTLRATASDVDGSIALVLWEKVLGPAGGDMATPNQLVTAINSLQVGTYLYLVTVTDNDGAKTTKAIQIDVLPAICIALVVLAPSLSVTVTR